MRDLSGRTVAGWRADAHPLVLSEIELDLIDMVLCIYPELRIVLSVGQQARIEGLSYPIESVERLAELLGGSQLELGAHRINSRSVVEMMAPEWFPIAHEGEFLSMAHLALVRCRSQAGNAQLGIQSLSTE